MKDNSIRLGLLFREAGFINDKEWQEYLEGTGIKKKQIVEVFKQEVSVQTFIDLATVEISLPFAKPKQKQIQSALSQPLSITDRDVINLLSSKSIDLRRVADIFVKSGYVEKSKVDDVFNDYEKIEGQNVDIFIRDGIITPDLITRYITDKKNPYSKRNSLGITSDILIYNKLVEKNVLDKMLKTAEASGKNIGTLLEEEKPFIQKSIIEAIKKGLYLPEIKLSEIAVQEECLKLFPVEFLRKQLFLPFKKLDGKLQLAISDPLNISLFDAISLLMGYEVSPFFAPQGDLIYKLNILYAPQREIVPKETKSEALAVSGKTPLPLSPATAKAQKIETLVDNLSTVQLVSSFIEGAITTRATDIHLEPQQDTMRVRFRIDGSLRNVMKIPAAMQLPVISRIKVLADMDVTERRRPQDGHFSFKVGRNTFDLRISSIPTRLGEKVVIRILDESAVLKGVGDLGLEKEDYDKLQRLIHKPYGMILVTGPTGSGKTSTLYASLSEINKEEININTIEDPIEYQLPGINQMQVDSNISLTFADGLRSMLRQDPDIIMVGEIRDTETAQIAIRAALTGHLVLSTLHTNTSVGAVAALMHMGMKPFMIASSIIGILSQRLVKKICTVCKVEYDAKGGVLRDLGLNPRTKKTLYKGRGENCEHCLGTGYYGRTAIFEILEINDTIRQTIIDNPSEQIILEEARNSGMSLLHENGIKKVLAGITTPEEVIKAVNVL